MTEAVITSVNLLLKDSFGTHQWTSTELQDLNRIIRAGTVRKRTHHPKTFTGTRNIPKKQRSWGVTCFVEIQDKFLTQDGTYHEGNKHWTASAALKTNMKQDPIYFENISPGKENSHMDVGQHKKQVGLKNFCSIPIYCINLTSIRNLVINDCTLDIYIPKQGESLQHFKMRKLLQWITEIWTEWGKETHVTNIVNVTLRVP
jgi:hypothetical protein